MTSNDATNHYLDSTSKRKRRSDLEMLKAPPNHNTNFNAHENESAMTPSKKVSLSIETSGLLTNKEQENCSLIGTTKQSFTPGLLNVTSTYQDKNENGSTTEFTASITSPILNQQSSIKTSFTTSISLPTEEIGQNPSGKKIPSETDYLKQNLLCLPVHCPLLLTEQMLITINVTVSIQTRENVPIYQLNLLQEIWK